MCATPLALLLGVYGEPLVTLLYGPAFAPAGPVLHVFGLVLFAVYLNVFVSRTLEAMDRQHVWAVVLIAATVLAVLSTRPWIMWGASMGQASLFAAYGLLITELGQTIPGLMTCAGWGWAAWSDRARQEPPCLRGCRGPAAGALADLPGPRSGGGGRRLCGHLLVAAPHPPR